MIWLNDRVSANPVPWEHAGVRYHFYGVMCGVCVDPVTARLTPAQQRILNHLQARAGETVSGFELRDAVSPGAGEGGVRVQVHRMREKGVAIESRSGVGGGYRVEVAA